MKVGDKVTWRWTLKNWQTIRTLKREYGKGPFLVKDIYNADPRAGHTQTLILQAVGGNILQKKGHSPGAYFSGKLLKKV